MKIEKNRKKNLLLELQFFWHNTRNYNWYCTTPSKLVVCWTCSESYHCTVNSSDVTIILRCGLCGFARSFPSTKFFFVSLAAFTLFTGHSILYPFQFELKFWLICSILSNVRRNLSLSKNFFQNWIQYDKEKCLACSAFLIFLLENWKE